MYACMYLLCMYACIWYVCVFGMYLCAWNVYECLVHCMCAWYACMYLVCMCVVCMERIFGMYVSMHLAAPGLTCGMQDLLVVACRIWIPDQGKNPGPLHWVLGVLIIPDHRGRPSSPWFCRECGWGPWCHPSPHPLRPWAPTGAPLFLLAFSHFSPMPVITSVGQAAIIS